MQTALVGTAHPTINDLTMWVNGSRESGVEQASCLLQFPVGSRESGVGSGTGILPVKIPSRESGVGSGTGILPVKIPSSCMVGSAADRS
ncbi:hypothetical protein BJP34_14070 [Moorena producens PAL-8-15-08-1]|uniref:Uncharacterized protein n=1 Tax=Moorena producens PAL-8-15-08-1 TaxID=1458985 RepID=A0A1D8TS93_9CYAN|nr:hypothetical protein BJP34_14070 [Moorena producens PAL-8-15-08-1]